MQKVLRKRILRDLKENLFRYLALSALIIFVMYLVVSIVGAADTIIIGSEKQAEKNQLEDGQFGVFVPLTDTETEKLEKRVSSWRNSFIWTLAWKTTVHFVYTKIVKRSI